MRRFFFFALIFPLIANAQISVVLQPHYAAGNNSYIRSNLPVDPVVGSPDMTAYAWTCSGDLCVGRGLFAFALGNIPPNAIIDSAHLYLYANTETAIGFGGDEPLTGTDAAHIYRVTENWDYTTVTWAIQPAISYDNAVAVPQSISPTQDYVLDVRDLLQDYINDPVNSFGFSVRLDDEFNYYSSLIFCSSFHPDETRHPKLEITYSLPLGIANYLNIISVSPNPCSTELHVHFMEANIETELNIFSITGQLIKTISCTPGTTEISIPVNDLDNGIYFIRGANISAYKFEVMHE